MRLVLLDNTVLTNFAINSVNARSIRLAQRLGCRIRWNLHPRPSPHHDTPFVYAVMDRNQWAAAALPATTPAS